LSIDPKRAHAEFEARFGRPPTVITRAPGRVNIIGEHTDYNDGFVLPMAIERDTVVAAAPREDRLLEVYASNFTQTASAELGAWQRRPDTPWLDYVLGVAAELEKLDKPLAAADVLILGDVPVGAGLSSSASLEMAVLTLFEALGDFQLEGEEAARLGRRVENDFLGVNSGIMDQFIARMGKVGHALFLDCRSCAYDLVPVTFDKARFVIADTAGERGLAASKYNERVEECRKASEAMAEALKKEASSLRDFSLQELLACKEILPEPVFRRARHVITENDRTEDACQAMRKGDCQALGALMNGSHTSLRADYEVTCQELDAMVDIARGLTGCYGARMTGAGFGGCTVNFVAADRAKGFADALMAQYRKRTGKTGQVIVSSPAEGASVLRKG